MKTWKRIFALLGAVILAGLYAASLIFALLDSPLASDLLTITITSNIFLPVTLYACMILSRLIGRRDHDDSEHDS